MLGRSYLWIFLLIAGVLAGMWMLASNLLESPPVTALPNSSELPLDHSRPKPQGGFYRCPVAEPNTCNPLVGTSAMLQQSVLCYTHDSLLDRDPETGSLRPALADRLPETDHLPNGGVALTFTLREGVQFSDGTALTLDDIAYTVELAQTPGLAGGNLREVLASASYEPLDTRRFRLTFETFDFAATAEVGPLFRPIQKAWFRRALEGAARELGLVGGIPTKSSPDLARCIEAVVWPGPGTGPYAFHGGKAAWRPGVSLLLTQNPHSWRRSAQPHHWNLAGIQLLFDSALAGKVSAALNEEIDYLVGAHDFDQLLETHSRLRDHYRLERYQKLKEQTLCIQWNCRNAPYDDPEVRRALTMLFDRATLCRELFHGAGIVPASWFRRGSAEEDPALVPLAFDPNTATAILREKGVTEIEILAAAEFDSFLRVLNLAKPDFQRAGVELHIRTKPWTLVQTDIETRGFAGGVGYLQSKGAVVDPAANFGSNAPQNISGLQNRELDALFDLAKTERSPQRRMSSMQEISRVLSREQPVTLLVTLSSRVLLHKRFQDARPGLLGLFPERWWIPPDQLRR